MATATPPQAIQNRTYFAYDQQGQLIGEYDNNGNAIQETVYLGNMPVATIKNGNIYYIHTDQLNTPRAISDANNITLWQWESTPFGETAANEDVDGDGEAFVYNLRFPGQYYDSETGLHYNYYRDYDPATGRYTASDPIGVTRDYSDPRLQVAIEVGVLEDMSFVSVGLNHNYAYAENSPHNFVDSRGTNAETLSRVWMCLIAPPLCGWAFDNDADGGMCRGNINDVGGGGDEDDDADDDERCWNKCKHLLPSPSGDLQSSEYRKCYRECKGSL